MLTILCADDRHHSQTARGSVWTASIAEIKARPLQLPSVVRATLQELLLRPGVPLAHDLDRACEVFCYVRGGRVTCRGPAGRSDVLFAGDFQVMTPGPQPADEEPHDRVATSPRVFCLRLWASDGALASRLQTRRFSVAERRGGLRLVASRDGRSGSVSLHSDVDVFSAVLHSGSHLAHPVLSGRSLWLHVVDGEIRLGEATLHAGDGASISDTALLSFTALTESEILLAEFGTDAPKVHPGLARDASG